MENPQDKMQNFQSNVTAPSSSNDLGIGLAVSRLDSFNKVFNPIIRAVMWVGSGILFIWTALMFIDVILRYIFNSPLPHSLDITQMVVALLAFIPLAYTQLEKSHISVDLITSHLPKKAELALSTSVYILCAAVAVVLVWQGILNATNYYRLNTLTFGGLPFFPATVAVSLGSFFLFLVLIRDIVSKLVECTKLRLGVLSRILMLVFPLLFLVLILLAMNHVLHPLSVVSAGFYCLILLLIIIFLGMPVSFSLLLIVMLIMGYAAGAHNGFMALGSLLFDQVSAYSWSVVPLYILMSYMILCGGLGTAAFYGAYKFIGHVRGGLALAVIIGSTLLAAVVGEGTAATVTMGLVAYPQMKKYKYADSLSTGAICAGATLGPIIPPSLPFIIYGIIASQSIGRLFIAGIIPGLILACSFVIYILIACRINPSLGPAAQKATWRERYNTLPSFVPIALLFLLVIGGIYGGVFTAMEGGAIGAILSLIIAFFLRKITWQSFKSALRDSMKFIGMVLLLITGSMLIANALGTSGASAAISNFCTSLGVPNLVFIIFILFIYLIFGVIADATIIILLTLPILVPILKAMEIDLIWFGVVSSIVGGMGSITPPYAMGIFMLRAIACPNVKLSVMYRGIIPFCIATLACVILMLFVPEIVVWLPNMMYGK